MSRKKCIRKHWNTAPGFNPVQHAIAGAMVTNDATLAALRLRNLSALDAITRGVGTLDDVRQLVDTANTCWTAGVMGIGPEVLPYCEMVDGELLALINRFKLTGRIGLTGSGIVAVRHILEYHDLQVTSVARSKYEQIVKKTADRLRTGNQDEVVYV